MTLKFEQKKQRQITPKFGIQPKMLENFIPVCNYSKFGQNCHNISKFNQKNLREKTSLKFNQKYFGGKHPIRNLQWTKCIYFLIPPKYVIQSKIFRKCHENSELNQNACCPNICPKKNSQKVCDSAKKHHQDFISNESQEYSWSFFDVFSQPPSWTVTLVWGVESGGTSRSFIHTRRSFNGQIPRNIAPIGSPIGSLAGTVYTRP